MRRLAGLHRMMPWLLLAGKYSSLSAREGIQLRAVRGKITQSCVHD